MRNCPHCGEPIQDEAVLCKHCHQEVQPPLWTDSMRRCPFCAEWIDLENEDCKFCGQHVGAVDLTEPSSFLDSLLDDDFPDDQSVPASNAPELQKQAPFIDDDSGVFEPPTGEQRSDAQAGQPGGSQESSPGERQSGARRDEPSDLERELAELEQGLAFLKEPDSGSEEPASDDDTLAPGVRPSFLDEIGADTDERPSFLSEEVADFSDEFSASQEAYGKDAPDQPSLADQLEQQHGDQPWWGSELGDATDYRSLAESQQAGDPEQQLGEQAEPSPSADAFQRQGPDFSRSLRQSLIDPDSDYDQDPDEPHEAEPPALYEPEDESEYQAEPQSSRGYEAEWQAEQEYADDSERSFSAEPGLGEKPRSGSRQRQPAYYESDWESQQQAAPARYRAGEEELSAPTASTTAEFEAQSSVWASEVEPEEQPHGGQPEVQVSRRAVPLAILQGLIVVGVVGGAAYGLFTLAAGPLGVRLAEALATDVPTQTPIPLPTQTLRPAPTLPPETPLGVEPTAAGGATVDGCVFWDQVTLESEGEELCVYGVIRRWFAVSEVPFVAIFSEELGTFAIVDRTTTHPVGPGDCVVARGTVEVMSQTRPNIDLNGTLELCPEEWVPAATATPIPTEDA